MTRFVERFQRHLAGVLLIATLFFGAGPAAAQTIVSIGSGFSQPAAVAVDASGNVFVTNQGTSQITETLAEGGYANTVTLPQTFGTPSGVALDASGNLFVTDSGDNTITEIDAPGYTNSKQLGGADHFFNPTGIAIDASGNLFVIELGSSDVVELLRGDGYEALGRYGLGKFSEPAGIAIDADGNIFISDSAAGTISEILAPSYTIVQVVAATGFLDPQGLAFDPGGNLLVADAAKSVVKRLLAPDFATVETLAADSDTIDDSPGLALDAQGNIFLADEDSNKVLEILAATTTAVTANPNPTSFGIGVTLTATVSVSAGAPTGTVSFLDGGSPLGSATVSGGTASLSPALSVGGHSISASYRGDANYGASTAPVVDLTVNPIVTTTGLGSSNNPSLVGQGVTFAAFVSAPDGIVIFMDGATQLGSAVLASGTTTYTASPGSLSAGTHSITAHYQGVPDFAPSTSSVLVQNVILAPTAMTVASSSNPSTFGEMVTFTAIVTSADGTPTGPVAFLDGTTPLGSVSLSAGVASFSTSALSPTSHTITASYAGDGAFAAASSTPLTQNVVAAPDFATTTSLTSSANPGTVGQPVTFTAFVSSTGGVPTGAVGFTDGSNLLGEGSLHGGVASFTTSALTTGSHTIVATYPGGPGFTGSGSGILAQQVDQAVSGMTLSISPNPSIVGQEVTFTSSVFGSHGTPTGSVTFRDGTTVLANEPLLAGSTSIATSAQSIGSHSIIASYSGDNTYAASTAPALTELVNSGPSANGAYGYQNTLGSTGIPGLDNSHFNQPVAGALDPVNGHLFIPDPGNDRVQVLDSGTLAVTATLGVSGVSGLDNGHLNQPQGVAFDPVTGRVFVADTGNQRIQIFDAKGLGYIGTLGVPGAPDQDNTHFNKPASVRLDPARHRLLVADADNDRVQVFDAGTLAYIATLGVSGVAGSDNAHLNLPLDATIDASTDQLLVADSGGPRIQVYDGNSLTYVATIGGGDGNQEDNSSFAVPNAIAFDPSSNLLLVTDAGGNNRVQVFDAMTYAYVLTLGTTGSAGAGNDQFSAPQGIVADPAHGRLFVGDSKNDRVQVFAIASVTTLASVLPGSRSVQLGHPATIFASVVNSGADALTGCQVALPVTAPAGLSLSFQTTDPATNALTGSLNTPATIPGANGVQTFLVTLQGESAFAMPGLPLDFDCAGVAPAAIVPGLDTVDLAMSGTPVADIIALAAVASNDGILAFPQTGAGAFAVAADNAGAGGTLSVSADTGATVLPLSLSLCQTNAQTGQCLATPTASLTTTIAAGATPTFAVFATASSAIPLDPARSRIFIHFLDAGGGIHGSSSVAVEAE